MKNLFTLMMATLMAVSAFSQSKKTLELLKSIEGQWKYNNDSLLSYQQVFEYPGMSKDKLFERVKSYVQINDEPKTIKENYPEQGFLSLEDTILNISGSYFNNSAEYAFYHLTFECKEERVRVTLSFNKITYNSFNNSHVIIYWIYNLYPIYQGFNPQKNLNAEYFVAMHKAALKKMDDIKVYLQGPKTDNSDW